jgi:hypothetical protein
MIGPAIALDNRQNLIEKSIGYVSVPHPYPVGDNCHCVLEAEHFIDNGPYQITAPVRASDSLGNTQRQQTERPTQED